MAAIVWALAVVCVRLARPASGKAARENRDELFDEGTSPRRDGPVKKWWVCGVLIATGITLIRLSLTRLGPGITEIERISVYVVSFAILAAIWLGSFLALWALVGRREDVVRTADKPSTKPGGGTALLVLSCGLWGFLLHNSIDFAIFKVGIGMCFWALIATALAWRSQRHVAPLRQISRSGKRLLPIAVATSAMVLALWLWVIVPMTRSQQGLKQASKRASVALAARQGKMAYTEEGVMWRDAMEEAIFLARRASRRDRWDPEGPAFMGRLWLHYWHWTRATEETPAILERSIEALTQATRRDPARFGYYNRLREAYQAAAAHYPERREYSDKALEAVEQALQRYPSQSELLVEYGRMLAARGRRVAALRQFERALEIEDAFLAQQREMWPGRESLIPRLRPQTRQVAKEQIKALKTVPKDGPDGRRI